LYVCQRRHSYRSTPKKTSPNTSTSTSKPSANHDTRLSSSASGDGHRRLSRSRNMTMPARRRTSSSGRSPRPPSDYREKSPQPPVQLAVDVSELDLDGTSADVAVYRVRNFSTKSGNVINRGDSIKVRRGHKADPENGSAKAIRRTSSDSASRTRRDVVSRQGSRGGTDNADSDGLSPSAVAATLLPDGQDDGRSPEDDAENKDDDASATTRSKRNVDDTQVYKVLVLGSQGVGKTTLVEQLMTSEYLANKDNSYMGMCLTKSH